MQTPALASSYAGTCATRFYLAFSQHILDYSANKKNSESRFC
jgi:hypothetical protein